MSVEAHPSSQTEATAFRGIIVYVILLIALAVFIVTWLLLRKFTLIWIDRPPSFIESIISGISAWLFLVSIVAWFVGIVLMVLDFFSSHDSLDIWMVIFSALVTGYGLDFYLRAKSGLGIETHKII